MIETFEIKIRFDAPYYCGWCAKEFYLHEGDTVFLGWRERNEPIFFCCEECREEFS
jgi:hypothetical protein